METLQGMAWLFLAVICVGIFLLSGLGILVCVENATACFG